MQTQAVKIDYLAQLANLKLSNKEKQLLAEDVKKILRFVAIIKKVETKGVAPIFQVINRRNVGRHDRVSRFKQSLKRGYFRTRPILER